MSNNLFEKLVKDLSSIGRLGERQSRRILYAFLDSGEDRFRNHISLLTELLENTKRCDSCRRLFDGVNDECDICSSVKRDKSTVVVVESDGDIRAVDSSGYNGVYLVVGSIPYSHTDVANSDQVVRLQEFINKKKDTIKEIVLAFSSTADGEYTADMLAREISAKYSDIKITKLAKGLSTGLELGYSDSDTIKSALSGRNTVRPINSSD